MLLCRRASSVLAAALLAFLAPGFAVGANAPTATPTDLADLSLEQLAAVKVATVYGASLHEQSITEAPSDVSIITADEIKKSGYRTLAEALNSVRGFYTTSDGVYDFMGTRGFNRPGDYGGRILITIDGHRMNDDIFGTAAIHSYELNYDQVINPHLELVSSLFYYRLDNLISFRLDSNGNSSFGNLAAATSRGGEIELDAHWAKGWRGRLSYTYVDARDSATDQRLSDSPEHLVKFNCTAPLWHEKVFANLEILGVSDRTTVQGDTLTGYFLVNATLFSQEVVKGLEFSASVYNLFDKKFGDPVSSDFPANSVPRDGRSFRVKLTYRF